MRQVFLAVAACALAACAPGDNPPGDAVEGVLGVEVVMGAFDPERGRTMDLRMRVNIDGEVYDLERTENDTAIGFDEISDPMELSGRRVLVAGEIEGDTFKAHYAKLLEGEGSGEVTLGIPGPAEFPNPEGPPPEQSPESDH